MALAIERRTDGSIPGDGLARPASAVAPRERRDPGVTNSALGTGSDCIQVLMNPAWSIGSGHSSRLPLPALWRAISLITSTTMVTGMKQGPSKEGRKKTHRKKAGKKPHRKKAGKKGHE
nr:hypothetical protein [Candidatus Sigynarchaeum springense]